MMIAKVIVDIPSKSVDFKFDYIVPTHLESVVQVGVRVIVPFLSLIHISEPTRPY